MPSKSTKRAATHFDPLQCQYPGGGCTRERTLKKNGELHWLCAEHRDHQNLMQRHRYRRAMSKSKKVTAKATKTQEKSTERKNTEKQVAKKKKTKHKNGSPHVFRATTASSSSSGDDSPAPEVGSATSNNVRVAATVESEVRSAPADGTTRGTERPAEREAVPAMLPGSLPCAAHPSLTPQVPQAIYFVVQAMPLALGASSQTSMVQQQPSVVVPPEGVLAAAPQALQIVFPQLQFPSVQPCVGFIPSGAPAVRHSIPSQSSFQVQDVNVTGPATATQDGQTSSGRG